MNNFLQTKVFELFDSIVSIEEFEAWVYRNSEHLEEDEPQDLFMDLISFNYKSKYAKQDFLSLFDQRIDWRAYEERRIMGILDSIIHRDENIGESIMETYELRCDGYAFFEELGMVHGLNLIAAFDYAIVNWKGIPKEKRDTLIEENYQEAKEKAIKIKSWIVDGEVILTGKRGGEMNRYIYTDLRKSVEKDENKNVKNKKEGLAKSSINWRSMLSIFNSNKRIR